MREFDDILRLSKSMFESRKDCEEVFHRMLVLVDEAMRQISDESGLPYSCCMAVAADYMIYSLEESLRELEKGYVQRKAN